MTFSVESVAVAAIVAGAAWLVGRRLWASVRELRQATAKTGCGDGCGCSPGTGVATRHDASGDWDAVASPTTRSHAPR